MCEIISDGSISVSSYTIWIFIDLIYLTSLQKLLLWSFTVTSTDSLITTVHAVASEKVNTIQSKL